MRSLLTVAALVAVAFGTADEDAVPAEFLNRKISAEAEALTGQALVDYINAQNGPFKAKLNRRFAGMSPEKKRQHINGLSLSLEQIAAKTQNHLAASRHLELDVPDSFDSRTAWPNCPSIGYIRDQSDCGSCWAFGAAEAISDRICIASKGAQTVEVSADDILACCGYSCGFGCNGGDPIEAFRFWVKHGVVSGGNYGDSSTCLPYPFPPCEHHTNATHYKPCPEDMYPTPKCTKKCQDGYNTPYTQDKHYGKSAYGVSRRVADIQKEIMTNGPLEAAFSVYEDFEHYYGGIYTHTAGGYLGGHAVRVLGWGKEGNTPYWLVANSWNEDWGEKGYFRIVRGINDCGFESAMVGGLPKV